MLLCRSGWYSSLQIKPYPVHPLTRPFATHHPLPAQSPTAAFPPHTFNAAVWSLIPAGAAGQRETVQKISTLSWLSMNDFKGEHRSYLQEISWKCTACIGKLVPVFYPVTCRISIQQRQFKTRFAKASYTGSAGWSFPAARAIREDGTTLTASPIGQRGVYFQGTQQLPLFWLISIQILSCFDFQNYFY